MRGDCLRLVRPRETGNLCPRPAGGCTPRNVWQVSGPHWLGAWEPAQKGATLKQRSEAGELVGAVASATPRFDVCCCVLGQAFFGDFRSLEVASPTSSRGEAAPLEGGTHITLFARTALGVQAPAGRADRGAYAAARLLSREPVPVRAREPVPVMPSLQIIAPHSRGRSLPAPQRPDP